MKIIASPTAPAAVGPYSQAIIAGDFLHCSGQIGIDPATNALVAGGTLAQAEQVFKNMKAVLTAGGADFSAVISATLFLRSMDDFAAVNELYARYFGDHKPARTTVEVSRLPKDALVELSCVAYVPTTPTV